MTRSFCVSIGLGVVCVILRLGTVVVLAQSPQTAPGERRFDVASVKPALSPSELGALAGRGAAVPMPRFGIEIQPGGRFIASTSTLKALIGYAFDVRDYQIDGGPKWLTTDYFDIAANAGADASPENVRAMLRTLLAERFGLRTHSETRQQSLHVLTVARTDRRLGPRLKPTTPECVTQLQQRQAGAIPPSTAEAPRNSREFPSTPRCGWTDMMSRADGVSTLVMGGRELTALVRQISSELAAPVLDRSELSGLFDVTLEYMSERRRVGRSAGLDLNTTDVPPPAMAAAVQEQLGLKLEKEVGPLSIVVVDAAEHPTPD